MTDVTVDYVLDVICDHTRHGRSGHSAPSRTVARILHCPNEIGAIGWHEWREGYIEDQPDYPDAKQTYYGEAMRLGTFGLRRVDGAHLAPDDLVRGMTEGERWKFLCRDCSDTLPLRGTKLYPALERLRSAGWGPTITLAALAGVTS